MKRNKKIKKTIQKHYYVYCNQHTNIPYCFNPLKPISIVVISINAAVHNIAISIVPNPLKLQRLQETQHNKKYTIKI